MAYVLFALGGAVVALLVFVAGTRSGQGPSLTGKTVVVHTKDDRTIRGVLHGQYSDRWTLRDAILVVAKGVERPLGGIEHIPISNIALAQELEAETEEVTA